MKEQEYKEGVGNPFDAPVPGQSLTDTPGNNPWEHPPQYTDPEEAAEYIWQTLHRKEFTEQIIGMLDAGIPVEAIGRIILFGGFTEGKFSPDVAFIITETIMKMIASIGVQGGVEKIRFSMSDITNKKQLRDITKLKMSNEEVEKSIQDVQKDIKKTGIMARPELEGPSPELGGEV